MDAVDAGPRECIPIVNGPIVVLVTDPNVTDHLYPLFHVYPTTPAPLALMKFALAEVVSSTMRSELD
jgi:hypothetical protein